MTTVDSTLTAAEEALRTELEDRIEASSFDLPLLPAVVAEVLELANDPNAEISALADLIRRDQALLAHVLAAASSALMGSIVEVTSLQMAVSRLGFGRVRNIAIAAVCKSRVFQASGYEALMARLFRHAMTVGAFAQTVARRRKEKVEEAFLSGVLHDVGRPIVLQATLDFARSEGLAIPDPVLGRVLDDYHARVGAVLVQAWDLSPRLADVVLHHHHPEQATLASDVAYVVALADDLAHWAVGDGVGEDDVRNHPSLGPLNLYPEDIDAFVKTKDDTLEFAEAIG